MNRVVKVTETEQMDLDFLGGRPGKPYKVWKVQTDCEMTDEDERYHGPHVTYFLRPVKVGAAVECERCAIRARRQRR